MLLLLLPCDHLSLSLKNFFSTSPPTWSSESSSWSPSQSWSFCLWCPSWEHTHYNSFYCFSLVCLTQCVVCKVACNNIIGLFDDCSEEERREGMMMMLMMMSMCVLVWFLPSSSLAGENGPLVCFIIHLTLLKTSSRDAFRLTAHLVPFIYTDR